jgi:fructoselysine-6-P-deglycase FrlB-like protein
MMNIRMALMDAGRDISLLLKNKKHYEDLIRETRWTEGPLSIVGAGTSRIAGLAAARAFEWLCGWPVAVRDPVNFRSYSLPALNHRSVVIAVSPSGEEEDLLDCVEQAGKRGATALAVTRNLASPLAHSARRSFHLPGEAEVGPAPKTALLEQAAFLYIACLAARIFNPHHAESQTLAKDFDELPERLDWILAHLGDAVRSVVNPMREASNFLTVAGGLYHPSALQGATLAAQLGTRHLQVIEIRENLGLATGSLSGSCAALFLSGSHCRVKKSAPTLAARLREGRVPVISFTDGNDRTLVEASDLAILLPVVSEVSGSLLSLALLQWLVTEEGARRAR